MVDWQEKYETLKSHVSSLSALHEQETEVLWQEVSRLKSAVKRAYRIAHEREGDRQRTYSRIAELETICQEMENQHNDDSVKWAYKKSINAFTQEMDIVKDWTGEILRILKIAGSESLLNDLKNMKSKVASMQEDLK